MQTNSATPKASIAQAHPLHADRASHTGNKNMLSLASWKTYTCISTDAHAGTYFHGEETQSTQRPHQK